MTLGPVLTPNIDLEYGNWAGAGYSADEFSPSFVPYTAVQEAVPGYDSFDAVARLHDIDYDNAQQALLTDLSNVNVSGHQAMINYLTALDTADQNFVARQAGASATNSWGSVVQGVGTVALGFKAAVEAADIQRLETDVSYGAAWDALANEYRTGGWSVALSDDISSFLFDTGANQSCAVKRRGFLIWGRCRWRRRVFGRGSANRRPSRR